MRRSRPTTKQVVASLALALVLDSDSKVAWAGPSASDRQETKLRIAAQGVAKASIVIGNRATEVEKFAAEELQTYLKAISGADLPISTYGTEDRSLGTLLIGTPRVLLKIVLYASSKGITSSRKIADCCNENVIFMALSADTRPHFTTIADFISCQDQETMKLFLEVLLICDEMGLIGKEMFARGRLQAPLERLERVEWNQKRSSA